VAISCSSQTTDNMTSVWRACFQCWQHLTNTLGAKCADVFEAAVVPVLIPFLESTTRHMRVETLTHLGSHALFYVVFFAL
jgi:hypothetical protein